MALPLPLVLAIAAILLNLVTFATYWLDKQAARSGGRRVRESTLLGLAAVGGSLGALAAQRMLRHKTRKQPFACVLATILAVQGAGVLAALVLAVVPVEVLLGAVGLAR